MSVATDLVPVVDIPARAQLDPRPLATVIALDMPSPASIAPPLRLTRRGVRVSAAAVAIVAVTLTWLAWLSAPETPSAPSTAPAVVTVRSGDTLWAIASRVAPQRDPRAEVATLQRINHLPGVALVAGQVLRTR